MRTWLTMLVFASLLSGGCRLMNTDAKVQGKSLLQAAKPSPSSVALEIIWARFPAGDPALNQEAWQEIDETSIDPAVRRELAANGLRAGVISGRLPDAIAKAINQSETDPKTQSASDEERSLQMTTDPLVHGNVMRLPRNRRHEISATEVLPSIQLLTRDGSELSGDIYHQAQAIYALRVDPQPDRSTLIELTPELHHGAPHMQYRGGEAGVLQQMVTRDREVFDRLRLTTQLAPGQLLVLMGLPDAGSRLGDYFHTARSADGTQQKLILIRVAEMPPGDTFAAASL